MDADELQELAKRVAEIEAFAEGKRAEALENLVARVGSIEANVAAIMAAVTQLATDAELRVARLDSRDRKWLSIVVGSVAALAIVVVRYM